MSNTEQTSDPTTAPAIGKPRWQISLAELLAVLTLFAVCFGMTNWLSRDFDTGSRFFALFGILPVAVGLVIGGAASVWIVQKRAGPRLCWLRLATLANWRGRLTFATPLIAFGFCYYFAGSMMAPSAATIAKINGAIFMLWMFTLWTSANILFGSLRLHEEGIVVCCGWVPGLNFTSWQRWQRLKRLVGWRFDPNGNLVLGRGWSRLIARVPPGQQEIVAEILIRKLGTDEAAKL